MNILIIKCIELRNFRNYDNQIIYFNEGNNNIYGDNAQGKTNILEAIFLCVTGRSFRTIHDDEIVRFGQQSYYIKILYEKDDRENTIEIESDLKRNREIILNQIKVKKVGELLGKLNAVLFCPENLSIIKGSPAERRRFLDIIISQVKPTYFYELQKYNKILKQRNILLKEKIDYNKKLSGIEVWNILLSETGKNIIYDRMDFIKRLNKYVALNHRYISNNNENLIIKYIPSFKINKEIEELTRSDIQEIYYGNLKKNIELDIEKRVTSFGVHRDDFDIMINNSSVKVYGSQGQQRTAVLSLKLSEINIIKEITEQTPVLLLDDVMSELDSTRIKLLMNRLGDIQTFVTSTEKINDNHLLNEIKYMSVSNGNVNTT